MILVLGASGRLGHMLRWAWGARGDVVWQMGRADGDVLSPGPALLDRLRRADTVVNLSGVTPAPGADLSRNVALGLAPFEHAPDAKILTASSAAVYGLSDAPHPEDEHLAPPAPYGMAKRDMEAAIAGRENSIVLRIGNVAGADQLLGGLGPNTPELHCFDDGMTPLRSYIGPRGLADCIGALARADIAAQPVNIAAGPVAMGDLLDAAGRAYVAAPAPPSLPRNVTLDTTRLHRLCPGLRLAMSARDIVAEWTAFQSRGKQAL